MRWLFRVLDEPNTGLPEIPYEPLPRIIPHSFIAYSSARGSLPPMVIRRKPDKDLRPERIQKNGPI